MNSPFANIFTAIQARIADQVPDIVYSDMNYGQLHMPERPAVAFPGVLIDFQNWKFTDLGRGVQQAEGLIQISLFTDPYSSTMNVTPDTYKDAALAIFDLEMALFLALDGWKPLANTTPLSRVSYTSDNRRPGLKVRELMFSHAFQDTAARQTPTIAKPSPSITDQML